MKKVFKLGTRKSLLAWSQSQWVANEIVRKNPGVEIELFGIETQGDRIIDIPLQRIEGKEFFVAELDRALLSRQVDLSVHSLKDLSLDRPKELTCAAIPERKNPRDVALFSPQILRKLANDEVIQIGTSSPRRLENTPDFLIDALPRLGDQKPRIEFVEIRGNVNSRLGRVHENLESARYLDGVILAFAGLIRLWDDPAGQKELKKLLEGVRWMILPLAECPTAPGQGALAIECRSDDHELRALIQSIHHEPTAKEISVERKLLADWGGGCHQRFGATQISPFRAETGMGPLFFIRGVSPDGQMYDEMRWNAPPQSPMRTRGRPVLWDGKNHAEAKIERINGQPDFGGALALFVAHSKAAQKVKIPDSLRVWTSGTESWKKLASEGVWVEGCAENLGFENLEKILSEEVLQLPSFQNWACLTHESAEEEWREKGITPLSTYRVKWSCSADEENLLSSASHLFWSSGSQFDALRQGIQESAHHACGPGKTWDHLTRLGFKPAAFPSAKEWRKWISNPTAHALVSEDSDKISSSES